MARYEVIFKPSAEKALHKLPETVQRRIVAAVEGLQDDPRPPGSVKLSGELDLWRIRVGDYRLVYTIDDDELIVLVVRIGHRKDVYRG
ncbi:MAG TPA: type II toxin-antitoxin system RelE/ParE family toxin [Gemmataceae bacterium]|jgi:mRNA interferase RelE/StbE|nr:type II toxin-antitoxin system RelE/ParE family toxin [Gemmataceae bacterium]